MISEPILVKDKKAPSGLRCLICGRFVRQRDPRRTLPGNPERAHHGYGGARHNIKLLEGDE